MKKNFWIKKKKTLKYFFTRVHVACSSRGLSRGRMSPKREFATRSGQSQESTRDKRRRGDSVRPLEGSKYIKRKGIMWRGNMYVLYRWSRGGEWRSQGGPTAGDYVACRRGTVSSYPRRPLDAHWLALNEETEPGSFVSALIERERTKYIYIYFVSFFFIFSSLILPLPMSFFFNLYPILLSHWWLLEFLVHSFENKFLLTKNNHTISQ